ncbi:hypothetical protein D0Y65_001157 [Glycine soja]|uniref:DDE Tnp4 domain-containing protein n=1 Tax=Glycine soja TaxID=3848 RepID=A0A445M1V8_GLYSO|nr:hypothetical protein D0Y65_001157 [Glycine soja]
MNRGLRDANGSLSKQNVERIILPQLNAKTKFPKTYSHYLSRMKWFRNQYNMMSTLMRNNSGFGWDPIGKTFTAHEDVWKDYLKIVGQNTRYCVIRNTFGRSQFATSENFHKILKALNSLAPDLMVRPGSTVPAKIRESTRFYPYFKDCIGAIDGTHIPASVKGRDVSSYRDRHGNISQNVLAACNLIWNSCHGNDPENEKELFNLRHASLRNVIERIFGIFKSRFTIFKSAPPFLFKTQAELVLACATLHNFLRKECRSDEFPMEPTDESSSSSSVLPNYEDNDHEPIVQTQEQEREDANIWRTNIGSDMWRNANN